MSALREAIEAVLDQYGVPLRSGLMVDDLLAAVEGVPVQVTIRDLDMADSENIVTVSSRDAIDYLADHLDTAQRHGAPVHLTVDGGHLKVKVGGYSWSAPIATEVYAG